MTYQKCRICDESITNQHRLGNKARYCSPDCRKSYRRIYRKEWVRRKRKSERILKEEIIIRWENYV